MDLEKVVRIAELAGEAILEIYSKPESLKIQHKGDDSPLTEADLAAHNIIVDELQKIDWFMGSDSKQIGDYLCFKATAVVPTDELTWYDFSWGDLRSQPEDTEIKLTSIEAWYTLQIPLKQGPAEYWGLPGLILEVSAGNTTMLCSQVIINPSDIIEIKTPDKGKEINKLSYSETIQTKMLEMRNNRGRRRG